MLIFLIISAVFGLESTLAAQSHEVKDLRDQYYQAAKESEVAKEFYKKLVSLNGPEDTLVLGYKGMASFMLARHAKNPTAKLKYFVEGRNHLEKAIRLDPDNLELRYLRFTVQTSAPEFLGYQRNIASDKEFILDSIYDRKSTDEDLINRMVDYMLRTKFCTRREKKKIKSFHQSLNQEE
ncbi:hypothetical protein GWO43_31505 [candidate division KSB1 bacterium]|nr:hypothetical protein [candidate division KSB1 bacterium]NIR73437.1 hypothetical protein [candidate division KSB1 bacterium]NIS28428.1 hypothetical protein [candidate division KSB1 bacterium]NIT75308.1 hypothetical protein [candidate division KSB1 bacterium]NIU29156.1 hypothetical protein [candidate division KSB1 bacterium]